MSVPFETDGVHPQLPKARTESRRAGLEEEIGDRVDRMNNKPHDNPFVPSSEVLKDCLDQDYADLCERFDAAVLADLNATRSAWMAARNLLSDGRFKPFLNLTDYASSHAKQKDSK